jgi:hypothetical protein
MSAAPFWKYATSSLIAAILPLTVFGLTLCGVGFTGLAALRLGFASGIFFAGLAATRAVFSEPSFVSFSDILFVSY